MIADAQHVFATFPNRVKRAQRLRLPIDRRDPSEALHSSEILGTVRSLFEVSTVRPYGGNLLSLIYPYLDLTGVLQPERDRLLEDLIARERTLIRDGAKSFCAVVVARKRP